MAATTLIGLETVGSHSVLDLEKWFDPNQRLAQPDRPHSIVKPTALGPNAYFFSKLIFTCVKK